MEKKMNVPEIRFQGFVGEWERKTLGEDVAQITGGGTPGTSISEYWNGNIDWYSPTEIGDKIFADGSEKKITQLGLEKSSACILPPKKTILFTSRAGIGDMAILLNEGTTNQGFQSLVLNAQFDTYFIYSMGFLIKKFAEKFASGSTFLEISGKKLGKMELKAPSLPEQTKIGTYFKTLDKLITLKQRKLDKLKNVKKSMLEKMFPREGAAVPEIRFQGFVGEWEKRKLGEVANFLKGQGYSKDDLVNKGTPIVLYGRLYTNYQAIIDEVDTYVSPKEGSVYSNGCEVIVPASGETAEDIARASAVISPGILLGGDLNIVYPRNIINSSFLALNISNGKPQRELAKRAQGKSVVHLRNNDLKQIAVHYPSAMEQTKIGTYFKTLDRLITLQQKEIEKLKQIKSSCLDKMFV